MLIEAMYQNYSALAFQRYNAREVTAFFLYRDHRTILHFQVSSEMLALTGVTFVVNHQLLKPKHHMAVFSLLH